MTMRSCVMPLVMYHDIFSHGHSQIDTPLGSVMKGAVLQLQASPDEALAPPQAHNLHVHALLLIHVSCLWAHCYVHDLTMSNQNDYQAVVSFMMTTEGEYLGA
jgi:hypothetical protein